MARTITVDVELESIECANCGITFAFPEHIVTKRRRDHASFYCPHGHSNFFPGESDVEKAQKQLKEAQQKLEFQRQDLEWYHEHTKELDQKVKEERRAHGTTKRKLTQQTKRIAHGVCPCCKRTFKQLAAHMSRQHPDYVAASVED
jgi:hypothetical protein